MNRPFTPADNGKLFALTGRERAFDGGTLEFPLEDPGSLSPDEAKTAGILWATHPRQGVTFVYVTPADVEEVTGLLVHVLRDDLGDCTNGGVTATATRALLYVPGQQGVFAPRPEWPTLKAVPWYGAWKAVPFPEPPGWSMFGGNFVHTSDARFPKIETKNNELGGWNAPMPVHDRFER